VTDEATTDADLAFHYPSADHAVTGSILSFTGDVRFSGHHGMLFVRIADPQVRLHGDGTGSLSIRIPRDETPDGPRMHFVDFRLDIHDGVGHATAVRLAADAIDVFNDVYPAGEPFDAFHLTHPSLIDQTLMGAPS
jgi:hypothetical protein